MEASEATPSGAVIAPDLSNVFENEGPFLTVYLSTEGDVENASQRSQQRWANLRRDLAEQQAPEVALAAVDPLVADAHPEGRCLAAISTAGGLSHVEHGPHAPPFDIGRWAPLPSVLRIIEWRQSSPPYVAVFADRTGADLIGVRPGGHDLHREAGGDESPIRKVGPGGWSQRRYQQRAENTWEENAEDVARELERLVKKVDARLVVVAGDVRALQLLREELPADRANSLREVEGGRARDGSRDAMWEEIERVAAEAVAAESEAILERFREEAGQQDRATDGIVPTIQVLARGQAEVLLIHEPAEDGRSAWFGPAPAQIATSPRALNDMGVEDPQEGRLVDVLVRAALGTGAGIRVIPPIGGPADGVGAILRWSA
jgi:hypothetical protein